MSAEAVAPFIGRAAELAGLGAMVAGAAGGHGGVAVVSGEAGIGKTRLCREVLAAAGPAVRLVGRAFPDDGAVVLAPVVDTLRAARRGGDRRVWDAVRRRATVLSAVAHELGDTRSASQPAAATRHVLFEALLDVVDDVAGDARAPVVWLLEDLHWADPDTWSFVAYAARRAPLMQLALLVTHRDEPDRPAGAPAVEELAAEPGVHLVDLRPLERGDAERLVHALASDGLPDGMRAVDLAERSGGLPLVVEELVSLAVAGGDDHAGRTVRAMTARRTRRLSDTAVAVLNAAAVLGRDAEVALLLRLVPAGGEGDVDELIAAGLLLPDPAMPAHRVMFRHPLVAEAVAAEVSWAERRRLHAAIAAALVADAEAHPAERVAQHLEESGDPARALEHLVAGARAQRHAQNAYAAATVDLAAVELADRHAALASSLPRLLRRALMDLMLAARFVEAATVAERLWGMRDDIDPDWRAEVAAAYANSLLCSGRVDAAIRLVDAEVSRERPIAPRSAGVAFHAVAAFLRMHTGHAAEAIELCDAGEELARAAGAPMEVVGCRVLRAVSGFHHRGRRESSLAELHAVAVEAADHGGPLNLAAALQYIARIDHRSASIAAAVEQWARVHPAMGVLVQVLEGWRLYVEGRVDAVLPIVDAGRAAAIDSMPLWLEDVDVLEAHVRLHRGELASARDLLDALGRRSLPATRAALAGARGWLAWEEDRLEEAVAELAISAEATRSTGYGALWLPEMQLPLRVDALVRLGRDGEATAALDAAAAATSDDHGRTLLAVGRGRLTGGAAALASEGDAVALSSPWLAGLAALWEAEEAADVAAARRALEAFEGGGAARGAERAAALLRRLGVSVTVGRGVGRRRGLSAREWQVAVLVADGLSNEAIARRLFLSRATVANHVGSILGKLEMGSRAQVAAWVAAQRAGTPAPA